MSEAYERDIDRLHNNPQPRPEVKDEDKPELWKQLEMEFGAMYDKN